MKKFISLKYQRIVSDNNYEELFDGIRFIAVISVILSHILNHTFVYGGYNLDSPTILEYNIYNLFQGVSLFFILSAFLLSNYLFKNKVDQVFLKYLKRRFVRIYPPYLVALTIAFIVLVFFYSKIELANGLINFLKSLFFANSLFSPDSHPLILPIAWTIEIEIQFYILLPFIIIFYKRYKRLCRILLPILIVFIPIIGTFLPFYKHTSLIFQLPYFFTGILLSDLYQNRLNLPNLNISFAIKLLLLIISSYILLIQDWYYFDIYSFHLDPAPILFFVILYLIIFEKIGHKTLKNNQLTFIGNMGYSLYLTHVFTISYFGKFFLNIHLSDYFIPNFLLQTILLLPIILFVGYIFYIFIEYPFMKKSKNI